MCLSWHGMAMHQQGEPSGFPGWQTKKLVVMRSAFDLVVRFQEGLWSGSENT